MSGLALGIVAVAAFLHASWNYLAKKSRNKLAFIWWAILFSVILFFPMFIYYWPAATISSAGWVCIVATGVLHAFYFWFMAGAYERGDLSLVYPLARGSGPLFVPILAVLLLNEQLSISGVLGITFVILGIFSIHLRSFSIQSMLEPFLALRGGASLWALCTGGTIAGYSLVDKVGVPNVYPPVYIYLMFVISLLLLSPYVFAKERADLRKEWNINKVQILIVGFLDLFTYLMILFALRISKVSYVAAAREVSIVFSAFLGIMLLQEKHAPQKLAGAVLISLGVVLIGFSR
ncbi:MAG: EamA family transporter [Desulfobacterales bacterium]|nr:EamA family transporter [Desulfobacterales bacterium]